MSGLRAASASSPARTEACRVAPPNTGGSSRKPGGARSNSVLVVGVDDRLHERDLADARRTVARLAPDHRFRRPIGRYCLGSRRRRAARVRLRRPLLRPKDAMPSFPTDSTIRRWLYRVTGNRLANGFPPASIMLQCSTCAACNYWLNSMQISISPNMIGMTVIEQRQARPTSQPRLLHRQHRGAEPGGAGADVGRHRCAVPPAGGAARRRPGRVGDDRQRRAGRRPPRRACCAPKGRASASTSCSSPAARRTGWRRARASPKATAPTIIDINMGCPARHVTNGESGSALMRDLDHALTLIEATVGAVVGAGDAEDAARLGRPLASTRPSWRAAREAAGVRMITVHGRTRCQFYKGTRRLGGGARGEGRGLDSGRRQRRHRDLRRRRRGARAPPAPTR